MKEILACLLSYVIDYRNVITKCEQIKFVLYFKEFGYNL